MKHRCHPGKASLHSKARKRCGEASEIFSNVRLIEGENWKDIQFVDDDARSSVVLIVAKTEPEPFEGFYIRRWDHPYEPNFETRTYNLLEFCQQRKVRRFFERGLAGNLIVWTRDEKTGELYFIGAYEGIDKMRRVKGYDGEELKSRTALMAKAVYVLPYERSLPMASFENEFKKRDLAFPSKTKISSRHSCYGVYVIGKELAGPILRRIKMNAVESGEYRKIAEPHTAEMSKRTREIDKLNRTRKRKINVDRVQKRFVTTRDMQYAKRIGIL